MDSVSFTNSPARISLVAWLISLFTLICTITLSAILLFAGCGIWQSVALQRLQALVQEANSAEARQRLVDILHPPPILAWATNDLPKQSLLQSDLQNLLDIAQYIQKKNFAAALLSMEELDAERLTIDVLEDGQHENHAQPKIITYFSDLKATLQESKSIAEKISISESQLESWKRDVVIYRQQYASTANEFAQLLSLEPATDSTGLIVKEPYYTGVLTDLPRLKDLADGLADFVVIKKELDRLGGKVNLPSDAVNPHQAFVSRMEELRASAMVARREEETIMKRETDTFSELLESKKDLERLKNSSVKRISDLISHNSKRWINPFFLLIVNRLNSDLRPTICIY